MAITLRTSIANRHVAFDAASGSTDETIVAVGSNQKIRIMHITLSASTGGAGVITFGASAENKVVLPYALASNGNLVVYMPGGIISDVRGDDLVINTAGSIRGTVGYELINN